ncbi:phosphatidylglycerophosphatase A [Liquorilactobacillus vini]|uniref:phosphatidylglycerophosphatase A family protein n=1 Tax=Liquorilactobacillus vini TaxID=238015 RepID=UPI00029B13FA|nr:phosphatidylglycerophosphatase A [Liquorilactobacillus vini]
MNDPKFKYPDQASFDFVINYFKSKNVSTKDIAKITYQIQQAYVPGITLAEAQEAVLDVLHKREVLNNAMVGLALDRLADQHQLPEPLQSIIANDSGVFGVDELLAEEGISGIYGKIASTNFGYLDKEKHGIIKKLDRPADGSINTFLDDIVAAIAAAAGAKIAHAHA